MEKILEDNKTGQFNDIMKDVETKIESFKSNLNTVKKCLDEKDLSVSTLEEKIKNMDEVYHQHNLKIEKLEKANEENVKNIAYLMEKFKTFDKSVPVTV